MEAKFKLNSVSYTVALGVIKKVGFSYINSISNNKGCVGLHVIGLRVPFISMAIVANYDFGVKEYIG